MFVLGQKNQTSSNVGGHCTMCNQLYISPVYITKWPGEFFETLTAYMHIFNTELRSFNHHLNFQNRATEQGVV